MDPKTENSPSSSKKEVPPEKKVLPVWTENFYPIEQDIKWIAKDIAAHKTKAYLTIPHYFGWKNMMDGKMVFWSDEAASLVTQFNLADLNTELKLGDLIFFESNPTSHSSKLIKHFMNNKITHVGMIIPIMKEKRCNQGTTHYKKGYVIWEMGKNRNGIVACKTGTNPNMDCRLSSLEDTLNRRKSKIWIRQLVNKNPFPSIPDATIAMQLMQYRLFFEYATKWYGTMYDPNIPSIWLTKDGAFPLLPRFIFPHEDIYCEDTLKRQPKNCGHLIYDTLVHMKVFMLDTLSFHVSPGEMFDQAEMMCNPFHSYDKPVCIADTPIIMKKEK